jgi:formylglycine-generating enzyme required for sulfatase activity/predicted Ser/Thr protein kinase
MAEAKPSKGGDKTAANRLGNYVFLRLLGKGGMGAVYEAEHVETRKRYAVKVLLPSMTAVPDAVARFEREVNACRKLDHPAIVKVHEVGEDKGKRFFAMDFVDGRPLDTLVDGEGLRPELAARVIMTVAEALQHAHEHGVVHRDVKPSNILLSKDGKVSITDFGIAREETSSTLTADGQVIGTPYYMSPEQALGRRRDIGPAADIYSLGITFYETLTRTTPFRGDQFTEIFAKILTQDPVPPSEVQPGIPRDLDLVVMKAIRKEPGKRYATAAEFAEDLGRFLDGKPVLARPLGIVERGVRGVTRHKGLTATGLAAVVLAAAFVGLLTVRAASARREAESARVQRIEDVKAAVKEGIESQKKKNWAAAREAFERAIALDADHLDARRRLATVENAIRSEERRKAEAALKAGAAADAARGTEALRAFEAVHARRMAALEGVLSLRDRYGADYESGKVNERTLALRGEEAEADRAAGAALDLFGRALLQDPASREAHRGIAALRMAAVEAAWQEALRTGEFGEVLRLTPEVRRHDLSKSFSARLDALEKWRTWKEAVSIAADPPADETQIFRFDLDEGGAAAVAPAVPGRFDLAPGSYVAEVRKKGYAGTRLPFVIPWPLSEPKPGVVRRIPVRLFPDAPRIRGMVYVSEGEFILGGAGGVRGGASRTQELPGFFIDRCEVSGEEYAQFLARLARKDPGLVEKYRPWFRTSPTPDAPTYWVDGWKKDRTDPFRDDEDWRTAWIRTPEGSWTPLPQWAKYPVGGIPYEGAEAYARSLGKRLPTSEEWEKAARGVDGRRYPWGMRFDEKRAACKDNPKCAGGVGDLVTIFPCDELPEGASPYGCLHMAGNHAEWTSTDFDAAQKVNRGACSYDKIPLMRASSIDYTRKEDKNGALGFRCARDAD